MLKWMGRAFLLLIAAAIVLGVVAVMPHLLHSQIAAANFLQLVLVSLALEAAQFTLIGAVMLGRHTKKRTLSPFMRDMMTPAKSPGTFPNGVQAVRNMSRTTAQKAQTHDLLTTALEQLANLRKLHEAPTSDALQHVITGNLTLTLTTVVTAIASLDE